MIPWLGALRLLLASAGATDGQTLEEFIDLAEEQAGGALTREALYAAALAGVADALNTHRGTGATAVLTRAEWQEALAWQHGERSGVGMEYILRPRQGLLLTDVYPDGPGAQAGLAPGDLVVGMDGVPFVGLEEAHIHQLVRERAEQPSVTLELRTQTGVRRVAVERARYRVASLRESTHAGRPCLRLPFFGSGSAARLAEALSPVADRSLLLDLRDNGGGLLDEAVTAADLFLPPGAPILQRVDADGQVTVDEATSQPLHRGAVVILVNRGTRGPAEAFAAALRDHGVARLVGTPSGGTDTHPRFQALGDDLVAQLVGTWLRSPAGTTWAGEGLQPDLLVEPLVSLGPAQGPSPDLQLEAASQLLGSSQAGQD